MSMKDRLPLEQCQGLTDAEIDEQIKVRREMYAVTTGGWLAKSMTIDEIPDLKDLKLRRAKAISISTVQDDMDQAKLRVLASIRYEIRRTCGLCRHASLNGEFGTCGLTEHEYKHEKHTGEPRKLSIHRSGGCSRFEIDPAAEARLHGFSGLMERA